jgi:AsmA protein
MPKTAKYIAFAIAGLIVLFIVAAAIFAASFDPNDYKPQIIQLVKEKKQRTLTIPGDIKLTFFPRIGADLGKVTLSEQQGSKEFTSINSAKVSVALLPLLSKQLVVDQVRIDGVNTYIRINKDGSTNFDDLLSKEEESGEQVKLEIDGIIITNSRVIFDDVQKSRRLEFSELELETGKIANNVPSSLSLNTHVKGNNPKLDARIDVDGGFTFDLDNRRYSLKDANAEIKGSFDDISQLAIELAGNADFSLNDKRFSLNDIKLEASGKKGAQAFDLKMDAPKLAMTDKAATGKLNGEAKLAEASRTVQAKFALPSFEGTPQAFKIPSLALDVTVKDKELDAKASLAGSFTGNMDKLLFSSPRLKLTLSGNQGTTSINGTVSSPFRADLNTQVIELLSMNAALNLPNPAGGSIKLNSQGNARADIGKGNASLAAKGKVDESSFDIKLGLSSFSPAAYTFDIGIDRLNVDKYRAKTTAASSAPPRQAEETAAKPMDLSGLHDLRANGSMRIGALTVNNIKTSNFRADLHANAGKIDINPLATNLYGGSATGALSLTASKAPRLGVRQTLSGVNVGPLLKDAIGKDPLEGKGNIDLNVTTEGGGFDQWKRGLDGMIKLELRDGAIKGINVAQAIRNAKARVGAIQGGEGSQTGKGSVAEKTDFSEMTGSFRINNGLARNDDLNIKSPLVRIGGSGNVDLGAERLDYLVKATVVSTLQGQGGPELQALKGVTVPVKLSGPFSAIDWRIDFAGMAGDLLRQQIQKQLLGKQKGQDNQSNKDKESQKGKAAEELLRGLFGK